MRVIYHQPWPDDARDQHLPALIAAGRDAGVTVICCRDAGEIEAARPDLILSNCLLLPKITDFPTYLILSGGVETLVADRALLPNLLSYDGYLATTPDAAQLVADVTFGLGAVAKPGILDLTHAAGVAPALMLETLLAYHAQCQATRQARLTALGPAPHVAVLVRCGGRDIRILHRAVHSIRAQTFGRFTVVLANYREIDLQDFGAPDGAIIEYQHFTKIGGGRAEMLFGGLKQLSAPYMAVLDDDDFWASDHMETLFRAGWRHSDHFAMAFSGVVGFDFPVEYAAGRITDRAILQFGFATPPRDGIDIVGSMTTHNFVARRDLLTDAMLEIPALEVAEDSLLVCLLARREPPVFSYRATAFYRRQADDGSNWHIHPRRYLDLASMGLRAGLVYAPLWMNAASLATPERTLQDLRKALTPAIPPALDDPTPPPAAAQDETIASLLAERDLLLNSKSWRLTAPLRALVSLWRRLRQADGRR